MPSRPQLLPFLRSHWQAAVVIVIASVSAIFFAGQMIADLVYFRDDANRDRDLRGWMTPRYVVMSYDLPRPVVADLLGLADLSERNLQMREIADRMGITLEELTEIVREGAAEHRAQRGD
ncbi:hypothetical protein [Pontivivens insulae]|uniref:Uncharacterized protein n=1 Tax=Pontivivens insulae TaxID=1639689 RepID=A0A2R8AEH6_9RHOB|nr:hypothetical protein [Pontivivens insulae]RED11865.1 hypothetical protein DFR53_2576 [Pontivivens insulae]SPF30622.1 hypothetical protein POI8812_02962 [Pontivivens insulae]